MTAALAGRARAARHGLAAAAYTLAHDAVVRGFAPYEALVGEISKVVDRFMAGRPATVLDVSCGTGTLAHHLAARGHRVIGLDPVEPLVAAARRRTPPDVAARVTLAHHDLADGVPAWMPPIDVVVSLHTLYWHPARERLLAACRQAVAPGGHAVVVTYTRPVAVGTTFRHLRRAGCLAGAVGSLRFTVPTVAFERLRPCDLRYHAPEELEGLLGAAGFEVLATRRTFLADVSAMACARRP